MSISFKEKAHGRVNLIGEHTDYNGGWVLPTAIPQYTEVIVTRKPGYAAHISSSGNRDLTYYLGQEKPTGTWIDYLQGATKFLAEKHKLSGFEALIHSTMPEGSGLSSSAALEVSFLKALRAAFKLDVSDVDLALMGQRIENEFVGARVGIMDQMAVSLATAGEALFLDTKELTYERVKLPLDKMDLIIINSGLAHQLSDTDGGYNQRRAQCEEACEILGIKQLRDIDLATLTSKKLPDVLHRRAHHVVSENARVHEAVAAIKENNLPLLGKLFGESHKSMRDDYEISIPQIDLLVELCTAESDCFGARLTGGGFGGSIVAITKKGTGSKVAEKVVEEYTKRTGIKATSLV
ncbi:MAG: galactokinase [Bdellovibrionota bacterium]